MEFCPSLFHSQRRNTRVVRAGDVAIGGDNPIRVQSMITCDTMDTEASIHQTLDLAEVGCEIVRITAPTVKDAANLQHIVAGLRDRGCNVPIVADIHFKPDAAMEAAKWVEKVRVNPGNYADSKKFAVMNTRTRITLPSWNASANGSLRWWLFAKSTGARCASVRITARCRTAS